MLKEYKFKYRKKSIYLNVHSDYNRKYQKNFRRKLRNEATFYEKLFWSELKGSQLFGRKFRRQAGFGKYVVDFYCPSENLVVELDGACHSSEEYRIKDQERDIYFKDLGIKVIRISNPKGSEEFKEALSFIASHFDSN